MSPVLDLVVIGLVMVVPVAVFYLGHKHATSAASQIAKDVGGSIADGIQKAKQL